MKIDCVKLAKDIKNEIKNEINGKNVKLVVISIGDDPASKVYIKGKMKACKEVGIDFENIIYNKDEDQKVIEEKIKELNKNKDVNGILVQLPIPEKFDENKITNLITPEKDVDGLTILNIGKLYNGDYGLRPCTPEGIMEIIKSVNYNLEGKKAVVIGRSKLVGQPIAKMLQDQNATVTIAHSKTKNLKEVCNKADILIAAIGKAKKITKEYVKENAFVIDVGINRIDGKLYGDVDYEDIYQKTSYITPVPKGVGPMTVAMLLKNTLKAYNIQNGGKINL